MRAARGEDLRLAVQRADGRCQRRVYYPGIGLAACSLPAALAVQTDDDTTASARCEAHYRDEVRP